MCAVIRCPQGIANQIAHGPRGNREFVTQNVRRKLDMEGPTAWIGNQYVPQLIGSAIPNQWGRASAQLHWNFDPTDM
jgi:hypothetical protein